MIRLVKKYWTLLRAGLVVLWIRLLLRVKSLPMVLDRLNPSSMTERPDEAVTKDLVHYVDRWLQLFPYNKKGIASPGRWPSIGSPGDWGIPFSFIVV